RLPWRYLHPRRPRRRRQSGEGKEVPHLQVEFRGHDTQFPMPIFWHDGLRIVSPNYSEILRARSSAARWLSRSMSFALARTLSSWRRGAVCSESSRPAVPVRAVRTAKEIAARPSSSTRILPRLMCSGSQPRRTGANIRTSEVRDGALPLLAVPAPLPSRGSRRAAPRADQAAARLPHRGLRDG